MICDGEHEKVIFLFGSERIYGLGMADWHYMGVLWAGSWHITYKFRFCRGYMIVLCTGGGGGQVLLIHRFALWRCVVL